MPWPCIAAVDISAGLPKKPFVAYKSCRNATLECGIPLNSVPQHLGTVTDSPGDMDANATAASNAVTTFLPTCTVTESTTTILARPRGRPRDIMEDDSGSKDEPNAEVDDALCFPAGAMMTILVRRRRANF